MGTASSQHCDRYDFLYGLPGNNHPGYDSYGLKAPLKSKSSSSLYILSVLKDFKGFSVSKSFFSDLKSFKNNKHKHSNHYLPLTPNHTFFSKSMSLNNFRSESAYMREAGSRQTRQEREIRKANEGTDDRKKETFQISKRCSQLEVHFSRMSTCGNVTYDNKAYTSEKLSQLAMHKSTDDKQDDFIKKNNNNHCKKRLCEMDRLNNNTLILSPPICTFPTSATTEQDSVELRNNSRSSDVCCRQVFMKATTGELLLCLGGFLTQRFKHLHDFDCSKAISWMSNVDRSLLLQGWQDVVFISPANIVFIYLLINSEGSRHRVNSVEGLKLLVLTCLYVSYTYMGNEISYPSKPFLLDHVSKEAFWDRCLQIINCNSSDMLKINKDPSFFADNFSELKSYFKN